MSPFLPLFPLQDAVSANNTFDDRLVFHPFTSVVIVLGGEGQVPADPVLETTNHGTFQTAIDLYREGYDVHMYDEDKVMEDPTAATGVVFHEVRSAIAFRGVTSVGIFGYSHGGGATYNLASQITTNPPPAGAFTISFTAYIDAVTQNNIGAENRLPPGTAWHLNLYQEGPLSGGPVPGSNEQFDVDNNALWMLNVSHASIDDHVQVRDWVKMRLRQNVNR